MGKFKDIDQSNEEKKEAGHMVRLVRTAFESLERRYNNQSLVDGVPTGFTSFDRLIGGLRPGYLYVFSGRPGEGKTSAVLSIVRNAVFRGRACVKFFSTVQDAATICEHLLCAEAKVDRRRVRSGTMSDHDWTKLTKAGGQAASTGRKLNVTWHSWLPLSDVRQLATDFFLDREGDEPRVLIIDKYHSLIFGDRIEDGAQNRAHEQFKITLELRALARELNCAIVLVCDINKSFEAREVRDRRPMLQDLRDHSGALESYADVVTTLYSCPSEDSNGVRIVDFWVTAHREGPQDAVRMAFLPTFGAYENIDEAPKEQ
jgi:replicative DNA helicase